LPNDPTAKPINFGERQRWRARHHAFRTLIARLVVRFSNFGPPLPDDRLRHVCSRLRAVLRAAEELPDEAAFFSLLHRLLDVANAYALARDELPPKQQATHFGRAAEHLVKARVILAVTGEPSGSVVREENTTLLDAAIEGILGENIDADLKRRDLLDSVVLLEQAARRAAELATTPPWSIRVRTTAWPFGLMQELVDIWTVILGRRAGASERSPFIRFSAAVLELLGFPKPMRSGPAIRAEYRRHGHG
jgi:hypothetical protein